MNDIIKKIYASGEVTGQSGKVHKLHSAIDPEEGEFLYQIIHDDPGIIKTLEVGCAYGLASLHICFALQGRPGASHTIIDPHQNKYWDGVGIRNLKESGIDFITFIEDKSEFALPLLLSGKEGQFDFIFIDGWHTFDHTMLDCFYSTRLLRTGGLLVIDDVTYPSVRRAVDFLKCYPCYEESGAVSKKIKTTWKQYIARAMAYPVSRHKWSKILNPGLYRKIFDDETVCMLALRKTMEDERNWEWDVDDYSS